MTHEEHMRVVDITNKLEEDTCIMIESNYGFYATGDLWFLRNLIVEQAHEIVALRNKKEEYKEAHGALMDYVSDRDGWGT